MPTLAEIHDTVTVVVSLNKPHVLKSAHRVTPTSSILKATHHVTTISRDTYKN